MRSLLGPGLHRIPEAVVPSGWRAVRLGSVTSNIAGGRFGLTKQSHYRSSGTPAFSAAGQDGFVDKTEFRGADGVVLSAIGANCGRCFLAAGDWTTLANTQAILPDEQLDARYLFYRTNIENYWPRSGSAQPFIKPSSIGECWLLLPPLPEQRRIAEILDTLDEAIRKTEQVIAKLQQMKQGLLHDLLTRGIDENGELRDPERHPEQFQDSPLGRIPRAWSVERFADRCLSSAFGPRFPGDLYAADGTIATLRTTDMDNEGNISLPTMPLARLSNASMREHILRRDDLVISRSGTCGVAAVFAGFELPVVPGAFLIRFRLGTPALAHFYRRYFNSRLGRPRLEQLAVGGVQKNLKGSSVLDLPVPVPQEAEVAALQDVLARADRRLDVERRELAKLATLKHGLMDDLLTGRVRVPVPQEANA